MPCFTESATAIRLGKAFNHRRLSIVEDEMLSQGIGRELERRMFGILGHDIDNEVV